MTLKDIMLAKTIAGGSGGSGGGGGGVVTMYLHLQYDPDNGWSGELEANNGRSLNYSDVLALTNNGADDALVECNGTTTLMYYDSEDEMFYLNAYMYNPNLRMWDLVRMKLSSDGYSFYTAEAYASVAVRATIYKSGGQYYSSLSYNDIAAILNNGGYVYVTAKPNGIEDCVYTLDKYAYITSSSGYITFKRIAYNTYNNVSTMGIVYFTINSSGVISTSESYVLQPNT